MTTRFASLTVADAMSKDPYCIQSRATLRQAHSLMMSRRVRHLPVLEGQRLVGLVSERDLYLLETLRGVDQDKEPVSEAMTDGPFTARPGTPMREVVREMRRGRYGSAVVVEDGRVLGIFTRTDALRVLENLPA